MMPGVAGPVLAVAIVVAEKEDDLSMGVFGWSLRIRELCGWRRRMLVVFRGRGVGLLGIRCLRLETRGRVFAGCISAMAVLAAILADIPARAYRVLKKLTLRSSHAVNLLMPSPASLKPSLASSNKSCTLSLTRSVSRFVPRRFSCCDRRPILEVREKSFSERLSLKRLNSGSS